MKPHAKKTPRYDGFLKELREFLAEQGRAKRVVESYVKQYGGTYQSAFSTLSVIKSGKIKTGGEWVLFLLDQMHGREDVTGLRRISGARP